MPNDPQLPATFNFILQVERFYAALIECAIPPIETGDEPSLGGQLFYASELNCDGRALLVAANIAGAASLTATADKATQKQAVRDGVIDFLVTDLDEALRILKNQLRKREPVAVCIAEAPETIEREMIERGVQPNLLGSSLVPADPEPGQLLVSWSVTEKPSLWLPKLDAMAMDCLAPNANSARRWLRLVPRYMGRLAQTVRLLRCDEPTAVRFLKRVESAELGVFVEIQLRRGEDSIAYQFAPPKRAESAS